jgi:fibronectin type 3 domain-containing protein
MLDTDERDREHQETALYDTSPINYPIRRLLLLIALVAVTFLGISTTHANQVTLAWNPSSGPAVGYRVYYGQQSGRYSFITPTAPSLITTTTYTVPPLPAGTYYFAVTAFDNAGNESGFSNEVSVTFSATLVEVYDIGD